MNKLLIALSWSVLFGACKSRTSNISEAKDIVGQDGAVIAPDSPGGDLRPVDSLAPGAWSSNFLQQSSNPQFIGFEKGHCLFPATSGNKRGLLIYNEPCILQEKSKFLQFYGYYSSWNGWRSVKFDPQRRSNSEMAYIPVAQAPLDKAVLGLFVTPKTVQRSTTVFPNGKKTVVQEDWKNININGNWKEAAANLTTFDGVVVGSAFIAEGETDKAVSLIEVVELCTGEFVNKCGLELDEKNKIKKLVVK
jgi:hypothetical protein